MDVTTRRRTGREPGELTIDLFAPGMTPMHRVGLAGLAMTLQRLGGSALAELEQHGRWTVTDRSVTLGWHLDPVAFFETLIRVSFRLTAGGMIWFPALGDPQEYPGEAVVLHNALLATFLQHPSARKAAGAAASISVAVDEQEMLLSFLPLREYAHQQPKFSPTAPLRVAGWLYPGGVVRHNASSSETTITESPERGLALWYAPVGMLFFQVHRRTAGARPLYALVIPEVRNLRAYGRARRDLLRFGVQQLQVGGVAEAAVRVLAQVEGGETLDAIGADRCSVVGFGTAKWSSQQKSRIAHYSVVSASPDSLRPYQAATQLFPAHRAQGKPDPKTGTAPEWFEVSQIPDLVAENFIAGDPWWRGFHGLWQRVREAANRGDRKWALVRDRGGLHQMVIDQRALPDGAEARLVRACHEAWRRRAGELGERAREKHIPFDTLYEREYEQMRIGFARCKNAAMLRKTLTDFWSRAARRGALHELQGSWSDLLPLMNERGWQKARDLALLALASYQQRDDQTKALPSDGGDDNDSLEEGATQ